VKLTLIAFVPSSFSPNV